jgi:hypothetical protein
VIVANDRPRDSVRWHSVHDAAAPTTAKATARTLSVTNIEFLPDSKQSTPAA